MNEFIHYMGAMLINQKLAAIEDELVEAHRELSEAVKLGDLRENSQYDDAKARVNKLMYAKEEYMTAKGVPTIQDNDSIEHIGEGSIVHLVIHSRSKAPLTPGSREFEKAKEEGPIFEGKLMFGGIPPFLEMMEDKVFSTETPLGKQLLGKVPGDYSLPVPAGYANLTVSKITGEVSQEDLMCVI